MNLDDFIIESSESELIERLESLNISYYLVKKVTEMDGVYYTCHDSPSIYGGECKFYRSKALAVYDFLKRKTQKTSKHDLRSTY